MLFWLWRISNGRHFENRYYCIGFGHLTPYLLFVSAILKKNVYKRMYLYMHVYRKKSPGIMGFLNSVKSILGKELEMPYLDESSWTSWRRRRLEPWVGAVTVSVWWTMVAAADPSGCWSQCWSDPGEASTLLSSICSCRIRCRTNNKNIRLCILTNSSHFRKNASLKSTFNLCFFNRQTCTLWHTWLR